MKQSNATSETRDNGSTDAPSTNGETGLTDHDPFAASESSNGTLPESANQEPPPEQTRDLLEERIRRLEDALALLNEMKERQTRETAAVSPVPSPPIAMVAPVAKIVPAPPAPITTTPTDAASSFLFHVGKQMLSTTPLVNVAQPTHPAQETPFGAGMRWTWFFFDAYAEVRVILRMFVDPRYPMSWTSRVAPLVLAGLLFTSAFWAPGSSIPGIGTLIDKIIDLPLAFLFFKVLSHEARRYRQMSPDLPYALRLPPDR